LVDAFMLMCSVWVLRGLRLQEDVRPASQASFWQDLISGLRFVRSTPLLVVMALAMGLWQMCHYAAVVVQILFATRTLHMSEQDVGLSFVGLGVGTVLASVLGRRISARVGPGPCIMLGMAIAGAGWLLCALAPENAFGKWVFALMLFCFGLGAVLIFINFLALRQAVTPGPMLGRMTSTMRWLMLLPAGPGALIGGWVGEHVGLRASLALAGVGALSVALVSWRVAILREVRQLPSPNEDAAAAVGAEASSTAVLP
jgi:predicted MFS family arabinose efflux permease